MACVHACSTYACQMYQSMHSVASGPGNAYLCKPSLRHLHVCVGKTSGRECSSAGSCSLLACLPVQQGTRLCASHSFRYIPGDQHLDHIRGWFNHVQELAQTGMHILQLACLTKTACSDGCLDT